MESLDQNDSDSENLGFADEFLQLCLNSPESSEKKSKKKHKDKKDKKNKKKDHDELRLQRLRRPGKQM